MLFQTASCLSICLGRQSIRERGAALSLSWLSQPGEQYNSPNLFMAQLLLLLCKLGTLSEFEGDACHFHVLLLGELVLESREELGVDFEGEPFHFLHDRRQVRIRVARHLLHLAVPRLHLLQALH
mmetsp:Transcript_37239/g.48999  ORF Transcript_37239/g.48999 Transcript_37239/m.48999 type:complete len:125 (+) Transcript_37239:268-642(+)